MTSTDLDPLLLLRQSIASGSAIVPTTSADTSLSDPEEAPLSKATHLHFVKPTRQAIPIDTPTRFVSNDKPVSLRSIYFAWLNREVAIPEYNASATKLNDELAGAGAVAVHKFAFVERLDLFTWLEGASEDSEYIKPLAGEKLGAAGAAGTGGAGAAAAAHGGKSATVTARSGAGRGALDPRLAEIYNGERRMGDRNTVLRGCKPIVCSMPIDRLTRPLGRDY